MVKKCEKCGTPALNERSEFCNRCGSLVREEVNVRVPVCSRCKSPAPNAEVLFCNRCGAEYPAAEPENEYPDCPRCGNSIHDPLSEFCNRCGAPLRQEPVSQVPVCSRCSHPAPDAGALFCNRCGAEYKKEPETPLCPRCGYIITDDQSQFCNRCGTSVAQEPVSKKRVCTKCGAPAPDEETLFCNRCGTAFHHHVPPPKSVRIKAHKPDLPVSIKISKKKHAPAVVEPAEIWDPVQDDEFAESYYPPPAASTVSPSPKKYAHLPLVADEMIKENVRDETIVLPGNAKKYAHLPLIADELKEKQSPRLEIETPYFPGPPKEKAARPRKGLFDLLKK